MTYYSVTMLKSIFIAIFYTLLKVNHVLSNVKILDAGVLNVEDDDMALILYVTLQNDCDKDVSITLKISECTDENLSFLDGPMGILAARCTRNFTAIYPNLYLYQRQGQCRVSVNFQSNDWQGETGREVCFNTTTESAKCCETEDLDRRYNCTPVDCTIKYSGTKNYFNKETKLCEMSEVCSCEETYLPLCNKCNKPEILETDLRALQNTNTCRTEDIMHFVSYQCHHGCSNSNSTCKCDEDWTTTCNSESYRPVLAIYHMCNIAISSWMISNQSKMLATFTVIVIFAMLMALKMLLATYLLQWICGKWRYKDKDSDDLIKSDIQRQKSKVWGFKNVDVEYIPVNSFLTSKSSTSSGKITVKVIDTDDSDISTGDVCTCSELDTDRTFDIDLDYTDDEKSNEE